LGGQALVLDVEGTWRELTGVVNKLAANLTNQVGTSIFARACFLPENSVLFLFPSSPATRLPSVTSILKSSLPFVSCHYPLIDSFLLLFVHIDSFLNRLLTIYKQVRSIAKVTKAVALGDLSKQIEVDARGEILDLKNTVNGMVVRYVAFLSPPLAHHIHAFVYHLRLRALAAEVTRVTLEVGSQGKLGGQAHVPDVEGVWFELVRNVRIPHLSSSL
jgi:HAMP domain-containing protein